MTNIKKATIVTIGDELLMGQTIDTNSVFVAKILSELNIEVKERLAIGDHKQSIIDSIDRGFLHSDLIIMTGGLGPTDDDLTKAILSEYFGSVMAMDTTILNHITALLSNNGKSLLPANVQQAMVPSNAIVLWNQYGTAPGLMFEKNGKLLIAMPGVPFEMESIFVNSFLPILKNMMDKSTEMLHQYYQLFNYPESQIANDIADLEQALPAYLHLAYLPVPKLVTLRLTATIKDKNREQLATFSYYKNALEERLQGRIIAYEDISFPEILGKILNAKNLTLGTAESCTGGLVGNLITNIPGSSAYYNGGIVSYANEVKRSVLGVKSETLNAYGAVSEPTVKEMAQGALKVLKVDVALSFSGILGPNSDDTNKPVGMLCIGIAYQDQVIAETIYMNKDRLINKLYAVNYGLGLLIQFLNKLP